MAASCGVLGGDEGLVWFVKDPSGREQLALNDAECPKISRITFAQSGRLGAQQFIAQWDEVRGPSHSWPYAGPLSSKTGSLVIERDAQMSYHLLHYSTCPARLSTMHGFREALSR